MSEDRQEMEKETIFIEKILKKLRQRDRDPGSGSGQEKIMVPEPVFPEKMSGSAHNSRLNQFQI